MRFKGIMTYLGVQPKTSGKGKSYFMVKLMDMDTETIYEFYVPSDNVNVVSAFPTLKRFQETEVVLGLNSFNGKTEVMLDSLGKK